MQEVSEIRESPDEARLEYGGSLKVSQGIAVAPQITQYLCAVVERAGVFGILRDCDFQALERRLEAAQIPQRDASAIVRLDVPRLEFDRSIVARERILAASKLPERVA